MSGRKNKSARSSVAGRHRTCWRVLWTIVLLLHAPITFNAFSTLLGSGGDQTAWSSILLLSHTNAFFILEIAFACSIRLLSDRRAALIFMLIVLFLHAGVIDRSIPDALREWNLSAALLPIAFGATAMWLLAAIGRHGAATEGDAWERGRQFALKVYGSVFKPIFTLRPQASACRYAARRGPPSA